MNTAHSTSRHITVVSGGSRGYSQQAVPHYPPIPFLPFFTLFKLFSIFSSPDSPPHTRTPQWLPLQGGHKAEGPLGPSSSPSCMELLLIVCVCVCVYVCVLHSHYFTHTITLSLWCVHMNTPIHPHARVSVCKQINNRKLFRGAIYSRYEDIRGRRTD